MPDYGIMRLQAGDRAVVTGASRGIGEAFARALAKRGVDLVLIARSEDRLHQLADELSPVEVTVLVRDLTREIPTAAELGRVDLLVNNAGFGHFGRFERGGAGWLARMVDLNVRAVVELAHQVLPYMVSRQRGGILNVGSAAGFQPLPYMSTYAATKAFVLSFSQALRAESRNAGITVTALCPGSTRTAFHEVSGSPRTFSSFAMAPERVVAAGLAGLEAGKSVVVPGLLNRLGTVAGRLMPSSFVAAMVGRALSKRV